MTQFKARTLAVLRGHSLSTQTRPSRPTVHARTWTNRREGRPYRDVRINVFWGSIWMCSGWEFDVDNRGSVFKAEGLKAEKEWESTAGKFESWKSKTESIWWRAEGANEGNCPRERSLLINNSADAKKWRCVVITRRTFQASEIHEVRPVWKCCKKLFII